MPQLVLLHALPFDHRMWARSQHLRAGVVAPTLYGLGRTVRDWAAAVLERCSGQDLVLVGSSVGGSCALEMTRIAPDRVRVLILVGTKVGVRGDPDARDAAINVLRSQGVEGAWKRYWSPQFSRDCDATTVRRARRIALEQSVDDLIGGVQAFHDRSDHTSFVRDWPGRLVVVTGSEDRAPTPSAAASVPRPCHQVVVASCGHYVPIERPEALDQIIAAELGR